MYFRHVVCFVPSSWKSVQSNRAQRGPFRANLVATPAAQHKSKLEREREIEKQKTISGLYWENPDCKRFERIWQQSGRVPMTENQVVVKGNGKSGGSIVFDSALQ